MKKNTGGQAFPVAGDDDSYGVAGMTLRDYFAAKALQGITVSYEGPVVDAAMLAYDYADAMLAEREK